MTDFRMRPEGRHSTDDWLTDPRVIERLGPFDLDPACHPAMPHRTAARMISIHEPRPNAAGVTLCERGDGLTMLWEGSVFNNPPWSDIEIWAEKHARHRNSIFLTPAKSWETKWGRSMLKHGDLFLMLDYRPLFLYPDGRLSEGRWTPCVLTAYGDRMATKLIEAHKSGDPLFGGTLLTRW